MKKFFSILMIIFIGCTGLLLGCEGGRYDDLTITITTEQARADDGSITLYVGEGTEDITVTMAGAPKGFNYVPSFSLSENIVKLGEVNHMLDNGIRKTIEAIAPGFTVLTAYTSEGSKTATLKINVIKKAESISYNTDYKLAVLNVAGHKTTIDTGSAISILPKDSNQNTIKYSLVTEGLSDVVSIRGNVLTTLSGIETTALKTFTIKAEVVNHVGEVNTNVDPVYMDVRIMDNILPTDIALYQSKNEYDSVSDAVLNNPITTTLVLSKNYTENNSMYVFVGVNTTEAITVVPPANVNSSPVMVTLAGKPTRNGVKYFAFRVQAIRYSDIKTIKFTITVDGYEEFYNFSTTLDVKCELYIRNFSVNDETLIDGAAHEVTLYTNDQTSGTFVKIAVGNPKEILAADARFFVSMYNVATGEQVSSTDVSKMFIITNIANNSHGLLEEGYLKEVTLALKLNGSILGTKDSGKYKLVVTAEQPLAFSYKATTEINIRIVQGISSIDSITYNEITNLTDPIKINFETVGEPLEVTLNAQPASETSYETLYAESTNGTVFSVEKKSTFENIFYIYPLSVGDAEIRFCSKNLTSALVYKVNVYEDIEDFFVSIDEFSQASYIGDSTVESNSLTSAVIKTSNVGVFSSEIKLNINTLPTNARFYETEVEVTNAAGEALTSDGTYIQDDYFKLNKKKLSFSIKFLSVDNFYTVKIKMLNFDGTQIEKSFIVKAYVPITKITMTLTNNTLYNPNNLGYFDLNHASKSYTKTQVTIAVNPNATYGYQENIFYEVIVNGAVTETLLIRNGNEFTLNAEYEITKYPQKVYLIAYALEFGKRVETEPAIITIKDPVTVQSMAVEGDINGDILYFKLGYDSSKDIKISLTPSINLFNSGVKWVQYAEGTTNVLDFADNGSGLMTAVDTTDAIFSITDLGNNNFRVNALKAGNARFLLIPEDKIKAVNGSLYVYDWDKVIELFVSVADGSRQNPYHVASFKDFKDIENAMDKFYVLTNNIAIEDNWIPLGYGTKTPLNGGINGLYSRIINAETGEKYSVQYKITDISYAVSLPSTMTHYGLVYALGDGLVIEGEEDKDKAILENMIVSYSYIQAEFNGNFIFGGLVSINRGTIDNCQVTLTNTIIELSGMNYSVGGMVGLNEGGVITNKNVDKAVTASLTINLKSDTILSAYFGGMVGQMKSGSINGYQKDYTEIETIGITFGDQGYDVIVNINITTDKTYPAEMITAVGGVVGYVQNSETTTVDIKDVAVNGTIRAAALNNVGGIVGHISGTRDKDGNILVTLFNNTNNAKIIGKNYVAGVIGKSVNASFDYCSAENYRETQTTIRPFITGVDYVGGFGGSIENTNITNSYVVSYFENPADFTAADVTATNSDIVVMSETDSTESRVGGFIASLMLGDTNVVQKVATLVNIYISSNSKRYAGGIFGNYNGLGIVNHVICKGFASEGVSAVVGQGTMASISSSATYYSALNPAHAITSLGDILAKGNGLYDNTTIWAVDVDINNSLPYLLDGEGNILFAFLPIEIKVTVKDQTGIPVEEFNDAGYVHIENNVAMIYLNELSTGELTAEQLLALNTHKITSFADLEILPLTLKTSRLVITSSNTSVVRVAEDSLVAMKEGSARITISSKLNADYRCEFFVIIKYGLNDYALYETSNFAPSSLVKDDEADPITMVVDKKFALYEDTSYTRTVDGSKYKLQVTNTTAVRFVLENETYKDSFIINTNWTISDKTYTDIAVSTLTTIYSKLITEDVAVKITATPFLEVSYLNAKKEIFFDHLQASFYVKVVNGADNIYFESSISQTQGIEITQLQSFVFTVIMDTDTNEDAIVSTITDSEGNIIDDTGDYTGSVVRLQTNSGGEANIEEEIDGKKVLVGKKVSYTISYEAETDEDGQIESLKEDKKFVIFFSSLLVPDVKVSLPITVKPQDIVSADIGLYSSTADYNTNASGTTKDGTDKFIFNGSEQVALLTVEIYPDFSKFASFDIVYTSSSGFPISMTQLKYTKDAAAGDDPFADYGEGSGTYITGYGIKVDKATGGEPLLGSGTGIYSYSKIYYFSLMVGSEVPDLTTYTMTLVFYDEDKNIIEPRTVSYTFQSLASPQIDLSVKNTDLNNNLPIGTSNEINVSTKNYTGDITWEVSIDSNGTETPTTGHKCSVCDTAINAQYTTCIACMNENYTLLDMLVPTKDADGKYFLNIPKDNFDLLGRFIIIKGIIEKSEGSENFTDEAEIKVYVSLYTVTDMSVDGLSADTLKLQIYTPYSLKVNLSAIYSPDVDYSTHPTNTGKYSIANMIARLKDEISKASIWQAIEETGPDTLVKNSTKLYNSSYSCISYGGYYAVYGEIVDMISSITATAKVGFEGGVPIHIPIVETPAPAPTPEPDPADPDAEPEPAAPDTTRSRTFSRQFTLTFTYQNDIKNPIPVTSAEDFLKMEEGKDYRLSTDIMLTDYTPLSTRILSLDGNGYTIYIASFAQGLTETNLGLFGTVAGADSTAEATMLYNLKVHYISNVIETITYPNGEIKYTYTLPTPPEKYPQPTVLDATALAEYNFGGIAGTNNGIVTNCTVTGLINITASDDQLTASYVGGLVGVNGGYITNSNVTDLGLTASGSIGGVVGSNTNTVSSTYTDELYINNVSKNTELFYTGGFVCDNQENAKILECYTQGKRNINDVTIVNTNEGLKTSGTAGGFVYKNLGSIEDCYSNVAITASAFSAGFVFVNGEEAVVNNCYSISRVALNSKAASPFTGIGKDGGVVVTYQGTISNCYYLADNYNNFTNEPATRITLNDFATSDSFGTYNIKLNTSDPNVAEGYSWYIAGGKPRLTQTDIKTFAMYDYKGKTKNYTANSEVYFMYNSDAGKWYAYSKPTGFDTTKEMIITRRATLIYYVSGGTHEYYFKPAYDINDNLITGTVGGKTIQLYNVIDTARADKLYFLTSDDKMMGYNKVNETIISTDTIDVFFSYIEEVYTEESGTKSNVWRDIETDRRFYKRTADTGLYENFTTDAVNQDPVMRFVYDIELASVTYKDGENTSLVDLSIDSEGECDLTYILTKEEYRKANPGAQNVPEPYNSYGGGYSYRSLDSIQYHYGYSYFDEDGNRIPPEEEETFVGDKYIHVLGSKNNPYLIYDVVSYNTYFKDKFNSELSDINKREYYRFVGDIDFDFENISTSSKILFGYVEGNGMTINNITLTYVSGNQETIGFGLFSQSLFSIVNNLNLEVIEIASSAHTYVGGLVGWARTDVQETTITDEDEGATYTSASFYGKEIQEYESIPTYLRKNYFNNIVVYKKEDTKLENVGLILGRNLVGGLVGYMTGYSKANNIDVSVNVNAAYVMSADIKGKYLAYQNVTTDAEVTALSATTAFGPLTKTVGNTEVAYTKADWTYYINRQLSYSGMAFGVVDVEIKADDSDYNEAYSVYDILVSGEFTGAGGVMGGVIGLLAKNNVAYNINLKVIKEQSIRGSLYTGGLIGENRGMLTSSTIDYEEERKNNEISLVTSTRENVTFFNNNASTRAIGGLVGFNNGGKITTAISHIDVRNSLATVAGGAVGRSIMGEYSHVIVSGSVRAKTIMGGFTGTVNTTYAYLGEDGIGVSYQRAGAYPNDNSSDTTVTAESISGIVNDKYTSCVAANNWQMEDYPYLTEKEAVKRVAGGFIGSEALSPDYYVNVGNENPYTNSMKIHSDISKCFYTNTLYYGSAGENVAPSFYMPRAYITDFDTVTLYTEKATDGNQIFPYMYPFAATNVINGEANSRANYSLIGLSHYQIAYGFVDEYDNDFITSSITDPITADGSSIKITVTLSYESTIEEGNFYATTVSRNYQQKTSKRIVDGETVTYKYEYNTNTTTLLSGEHGFVYSEKLKPDGVTVDSREFGVFEKYFVYRDFTSSGDFSIGENFYGTIEDETYTIYPKVHIRSSSLDWLNYAGTEFSSKDGYYLIESERDLATLAKVVNNNTPDSKNGGYYRDKDHKYKLVSNVNLDLSGKYWTPIGTEDYPFQGEFEGNGQTIANANMTLEGARYAGLFGYTKGTVVDATTTPPTIKYATIKNLTVTGGSIIGVQASGASYTGGLVGFAELTYIANCINENSVTGTTFVGGIAGEAMSTVIIDSYNRGKITLESANLFNVSAAGGLVGYSTALALSYTAASENARVNTGDIVVADSNTSYSASPAIKGSTFAGGLVGNHEGSTSIEKFIYNTGDITVTSNAHNINVGGAFGYYSEYTTEGTGYKVSKIRNNGNIAVYDANTFSVTSSTEYTSNLSPLAIAAVGGIIGKFETSADAKIGLFSNNGTIMFDNQMTSRSVSGVGGIVGVISSRDAKAVTTLDQSYNSSDIEVKVNGGDINIAIGVGGILGQHSTDKPSLASRVDIDNCYNMGDIASSGMGRVLSGGIYGVSAVRNYVGTASTSVEHYYAIGNDLLNNGASVGGTYAHVSNSYNIGSVTGSSSNTYGLGALLGYEIGASCYKFGETYGKNYYLAGCASYPYAKMEKSQTTNEAGEVETVETITTSLDVLNSCEQKTTNTLKLYIADAATYNNVGISFIGYSTNWEQKVSTWYPTLKNNYEILLWDDNTAPLSVQGQDFTIDNAEQLAYLSYAVNNGIIDTTGVQFKLTNNIDMSNRFFTPIGNITYPFMGTFNGDGYSINNITIDPNSALTIMDSGFAETVGALFGYVDGGQIKNTGLVSPIIKNVDYAAGFAYKLSNTSHMEYCYTDNYEIADPDVAGLPVADRIKEGLISGKKETSGFIHTIENSTINAGYINVPLATNPVEDETYKPSLAGFAINSVSSMISNCYVSSGVEGGNAMFTYNTYNNTTPLFDKFILSSVDADGVEVEGVYHCYNLAGGNIKYTTPDGSLNTNAIPSNLTTTGVGSGAGETDSYTLQQEGWDVIDIWSYEYSLLGDMSESTQSATIRGLGQNWYNTECEDLILKNNVGNLITNRNEATDTGLAQYYIYYEITTAEELAWVARMINNGQIDSKDSNGNLYVFKLMNDINLLGKYWTPIGTMDYPFSSKFDFNGYTISNLVIDTNDMSFGGLFGYTQEAEIIGGFMDNVYINIDITSEEYNSLTSVKGLYIGALIGKGNNTKVSNIEINGCVVGYSKYNAYVGGLAGNLTFAKSTTTGTAQDYKVDNIKVKVLSGSEVLIPEDYRKNNGFGIDEIITEATESEKLMVNIAGFSLTGNSYTGGILGYVSGKYTISYTTEAWVEQVYNEAVVVSYAKADISRSYGGGIVGFMTENTHLNIAQNIGSVKSATYGYDYIGGVAGIIDGGSEITNVVNKGYVECSQFASVISYSGGVAGYIRGGSTATTSANLGTSYKNIDSTKIFSAGAFGYVEKDATGALPTVRNVVYTDLYGAYENPNATGDDDATIGYYGDGELIADDGSVTVAYINTLQDDLVKDVFVLPIWNPVSGDVSYSSTYEITFDSTVLVYVKTAPDATTYTSMGTGGSIAMGTEIVIQVTDPTAKYIIINSRRYELTHIVSGSGTISVSEAPDGGTGADCIVIKQLANGISMIRAEAEAAAS